MFRNSVRTRLVSTFPFTGDASRAVALSGILTAVIRSSIPIAPLHAFTAPTYMRPKARHLTDGGRRLRSRKCSGDRLGAGAWHVLGQRFDARLPKIHTHPVANISSGSALFMEWAIDRPRIFY
jgi:hypothetical protein